jgi:DNA-binding NarL/FixJ family response regulator
MIAENVRLLVVATRNLAGEIRELVAAEGLPEPLLGDGGDETYTLYRQKAPHVVILAAELERGDSRALAAAIKDGEHGRFVKVILVGDETGPIRNALDAADFEVDRFLGRPLSRKALAFAVSSCASAALEAERRGGAAPRPPPIPAPSSTPPPIPMAALRASSSRSRPPAPARAIAARPAPAADPEATPPPREPTLIVSPARTAAQPAEAIEVDDGGGDGEDAPLATENTAAVARNPRIDEAMEAAIAEFVSDAIRTMGPTGRGVSQPSAVEAPVAELETERAVRPEWREPTMILTGSTSSSGSSPMPRLEGELEVTHRSAAAPWGAELDLDEPGDGRDLDELEGLGSLAPLDDLDDLDDLDEIGDLDGEPESAASTARRPPPEPVEPRAGGLARELRRKMSAMAERLFPDRLAEGHSQVTVSLPHDANTEIDFAALEQTTGVNAAPYRGIGQVQTFADTNPMIAAGSTAPAFDVPQADSAGAAGRATPVGAAVDGRASGDLGAGDEDIAMLVARLHQGKFSGSLSVHRGEARKSIYLDDGRPVFASSTDAHDRMGDLLYREGKITREQHAVTRERVVSSGRRMGELLVEMGFLKPRELLPAVRRHIEDIIYSVFAWDSGTYTISEREPPTERIRLSRHPAALVVEGVRRKYTPERLASVLGPGEVVLAPRAAKAMESIAHVADLGSEERAALALFDGARSLAHVCRECGLDELTLGQIAFAMVALGGFEVVFRGDDEVTQTDAGRGSALVGETDITIDRQRVLAKLALVEEADYFMLLGVRRDASRFEIQRAYEAARRDYAREAFTEAIREELAGELDTINALIEEAYRILRDDGMRRAYLANLG